MDENAISTPNGLLHEPGVIGRAVTMANRSLGESGAVRAVIRRE